MSNRLESYPPIIGHAYVSVQDFLPVQWLSASELVWMGQRHTTSACRSLLGLLMISYLGALMTDRLHFTPPVYRPTCQQVTMACRRKVKVTHH